MTEVFNNYINGELSAPLSGEYIDVEEPARGEVYAKVASSSQEDLDIALNSASYAYPAWSRLSVSERAKYFIKIANKLEDNFEELAILEAKDTGKPIKLTRASDIPRAIANFKFFAETANDLCAPTFPMDNGFNYSVYESIGVVGCISPWNLPLYLFTWKIAPALITGNTVIAKPSELTPATANKLAKICIEVGLPKGVLNILHGYGDQIGSSICKSPEVKAISFTGGSATGAKIAQDCAPSFKKLSLELGGKNPAIVFADCDLEKTVAGLLKAAFTNQGQVCQCASRIYVEDSIYEEFKNKFITSASKLSIGDPEDPTTDIGSIISKAHAEKVIRYIELAKQEGILLTGGNRIDTNGMDGCFIEPTVFEMQDPKCSTNKDEIFGPVTTLQRFSSFSEVIDLANFTDYGLSATVWSQDINKCHEAAKQIKAGTIWINSWMQRDLRVPLGGFNKSGIGKEGGKYALEFFSDLKNICVNL